MQPIIDYLNRGGAVIGLRTATHGFRFPKESPFYKYSYNYKGEDFVGGFGRQILGETWVGHYGPNHKSSTRLDIVPDQASHPVLTGVKDRMDFIFNKSGIICLQKISDKKWCVAPLFVFDKD